MILKVAAPVVGALGRRRRRVYWDLDVLPLMSGFWTKQEQATVDDNNVTYHDHENEQLGRQHLRQH
eukprot:2147868-Heterocapsa_arctica.AAC.1